MLRTKRVLITNLIRKLVKNITTSKRDKTPSTPRNGRRFLSHKGKSQIP